MKKLSLYVFLVLMVCNVGFAKCIEGDCKNGYGTYILADGGKYVGEYKDGKRIGCITGDCKNGYGTYIEANGDNYVGEFKDNKFQIH